MEMADSRGPRKKAPSRSRVQSGPLKQTTLKLSPGSEGARSGGSGKPGGGSAGKAHQPSTPTTKLTFSEVKGDLFGCPASFSLAHCVSEDMAMGRGVAVLFKEQFGSVGALRAQGRFVGM